MMPLRKIKAFTLLEVLLTMLLTILVIGITYSAYIIIDKQFKRSKTAEERMYELSLLSYLIERDVNSAKMILCRADGFLARMNETDEIEYSLTEKNSIVRLQKSLRDTFKVELEEINLLWSGRPCGTGDLADYLEMNLKTEGGIHFMRFSKKYASDILMAKMEDKN